jgi:hypothetical protein
MEALAEVDQDRVRVELAPQQLRAVKAKHRCSLLFQVHSLVSMVEQVARVTIPVAVAVQAQPVVQMWAMVELAGVITFWALHTPGPEAVEEPESIHEQEMAG